MPALETDRESAEWVRSLAAEGPAGEAAAARLHALLLRVARAESVRRRPSLPDRGLDEVDDLCVQAANDALVAILRKLPEFRGAARFTTWACKFVIFEISSRLRRHSWRQRQIATDDAIWERLPDSSPPAISTIQDAELRKAVLRAVGEDLTEKQRRVFQSAVLDEVPIDVLAERLGSTRGAIYKTLHDARARLRQSLAAAGHLEGTP